MSISDTDLDDILAKPATLTVVPAKANEPTPEQEEQAKFDAVMTGPFTPEALKDAALKAYNERLPRFLHSTEMQMKSHAARGAFVVELDSQGVKNYQQGVVADLKEKGWAAEIDGTRIIVTLVPEQS